jgi:hypothetical protein
MGREAGGWKVVSTPREFRAVRCFDGRDFLETRNGNGRDASGLKRL